MTEKEKQLLLSDISARYMNGLMCVVEGHEGVYQIVGTYRREGYGAAYAYIDVAPFGDIIIDIVKPYLRPMSSMTEEEREELIGLLKGGYLDEDTGIISWYFCHRDGTDAVTNAFFFDTEHISKFIEFLNTHHFDYRGLIEKGLALEAPEGMYNLN